MKPHICGKNRTNLPTSGCSDCSELAYRLDKIEEWLENPIDDELLDALTPLECYQPPCGDAIVCQAKTCCDMVVCGDTPIEPACEDYGTPYYSFTSEASLILE